MTDQPTSSPPLAADRRSTVDVGGDSMTPEPDALAQSPPAAKKRPSMFREIIETLLLALVIFLAVRTVVLNFRVDGVSMQPSLVNNEMLLVNRNAYFAFDRDRWFGWIPGVDTDEGDGPTYPFGTPERGDIVVLNPPPSANEDKPYIKRVIGEPGDTVEVRGDAVFINGEQIDEPYIDDGDWSCKPSQICGPLTVPEDAVFVLGDNRDNSEDSRFFGVVPIDNIIGKAWITYWPAERIEFVPHEDYPELSD
jgi:signal peptidase I